MFLIFFVDLLLFAQQNAPVWKSTYKHPGLDLEKVKQLLGLEHVTHHKQLRK